MAGGGGTFVMGCWLEGLMPPFRLYRDGSSPPELRLDALRERRSRRRAARSAAASSAPSRRKVT